MCLITCQSHTIIHDRIEWNTCNHKSNYTQLCKFSHGYIEKVHTTKIISSGIHTWPKLHKNKDMLNGLWSPKKFTLQQIITYLAKPLAILGFYSSIAPSTTTYTLLPFLYLQSGSWSCNGISQHLTISMKVHNPNLKIA